MVNGNIGARAIFFLAQWQFHIAFSHTNGVKKPILRDNE